MKSIPDEYVYKKEVDWSLFKDGFAIPKEHQVVFGQVAGRLLERGDTQTISLILDGKTYKAKLTNQKIDAKFGPHADKIQIRYNKNDEIAQALRDSFRRSYAYICEMKAQQEKGSKKHIKLPDEYKEYLAIYTTEYDDTYVLETIGSLDMDVLRTTVSGQSERVLEAQFNFDTTDDTAGLREKEQIVKIRKLNKKIGDNLKRLYGYKCQICGKLVGEEYGSHVVEAHHIDYFVRSLNNDANNQLIVCPNHHSIIHDVDPVFDRKHLLYRYDNGFEEKLLLNKHLY
ncbi:MAG: HNH endonuclease signature motif containing protein [Lachnospiraceae bacterium]|nr:HNH endonuclease signature motif containing protein [Lachnospiraceae bacterium]